MTELGRQKMAALGRRGLSALAQRAAESALAALPSQESGRELAVLLEASARVAAVRLPAPAWLVPMLPPPAWDIFLPPLLLSVWSMAQRSMAQRSMAQRPSAPAWAAAAESAARTLAWAVGRPRPPWLLSWRVKI